MKPLFYFYQVSILVSVILAFYFRKDLKARQLMILGPYLFLVFIQEALLGYVRMMDPLFNNAIIYNIYRPINVLVFALLYYQVPFMKPYRKTIFWTTAIYLLVNLIHYSFIESIHTVSTYLILARGFIITFFGILFLFKYFLLDNIQIEKFWHPYIWITIGIVIFYPVISISISLQKFILASGSGSKGFELYNIIPQVMSIFMYGCFSYAFYLCQRKKLILS
jgi:hypothetical protein